MRRPLPLFLLVASCLLSCGEGRPSGIVADPYAPALPPAEAPAGLEPATWRAHLEQELLPFWRMEEAKGSPLGNFPTRRTMSGAVASGSTTRKSRMLGRQTYAYAVSYLMTGDEELLSLSRAGTRWILDHARDGARGGFHPDLDENGNPVGNGDKWAQDASYIAMGPAAYFFVTRDPEAEAAVLAARDLLFDPATFWDAEQRRIRDGLDGALTTERFMTAAYSSELVAQLDPVTAFLLLVQPVLSADARREQVLGDLRTLATTMKEQFWRDGLFWGTTAGIGQYGSRHTDFGHSLKAYWALSLIDRRLPDQPFQAFLSEHLPGALTFALDTETGRWASRPLSPTTKAYGSDWWQYAEADQVAATLALHDPAFVQTVGTSAEQWRARFVDRSRPAGEVFPSIKRDGSGWGWSDSDTAKCNEWKSGFHSTEHALVLYLFSHWLHGEPAPLYFAFPADRVAELAAASRPYTLLGRVVDHQDLGPLAADPSLHKVRVRFDQLR
ncbi:MAG TPA: AGE family epimerase/isomerase [Aggregicoccus sp.]|nr:AGE family epimerase/isomerase [Aggregicoccus sp.]